MKREILTGLTLMVAVCFAQAQTTGGQNEKMKEKGKEPRSERVALRKLEGTGISAMALNSFKTDFGAIQNVEWKRNGTFDEAKFLKEGKRTTAFYDIDGQLVGFTREAKLSDLPPKAQQEIKTSYKDYVVTAVVFFDDNESNATDMIMYGIQFDDTDTWLAELSNGKSGIVVQVMKDGTVSFFKQL